MSSHGRVIGKAGKIMWPKQTMWGYASVYYHFGSGKRKWRPVHQLVAEAFYGPRPSPDHQVCHKDGCRLNNHVSNLSWGTRSDNMQDRIKHQTAREERRSPRCILTADQVREIRRREAPGVEYARRFGVKPATIYEIWQRKNWAWLDDGLPEDDGRAA